MALSIAFGSMLHIGLPILGARVHTHNQPASHPSTHPHKIATGAGGDPSVVTQCPLLQRNVGRRLPWGGVTGEGVWRGNFFWEYPHNAQCFKWLHNPCLLCGGKSEWLPLVPMDRLWTPKTSTLGNYLLAGCPHVCVGGGIAS